MTYCNVNKTQQWQVRHCCEIKGNGCIVFSVIFTNEMKKAESGMHLNSASLSQCPEESSAQKWHL